MTPPLNAHPAAAKPSWTESLRTAIGRYPALLLLAGVLAGIVPTMEDFRLISLLPVLLGAVVIGLVFRRYGLIRFIPAAAVGMISAALTGYLPADHYRRIVDRDNCGAEIIFTVSDPSCAGTAVPWLKSPGWIYGTVSSLRLSPLAPWRKVSGRAVIHLPPDTPPPADGDVILARGSFTIPPGKFRQTIVSLASGTTFSAPLPVFDFRSFLRSKGAYHVFRVREFQVTGRVVTPETLLLSLRNRLLVRTGEHIDSDRNRNLMAALIFGCRQGLDWYTRQDFIRTGTIHIFTVSGFHVGILAWLLLLALRGVPFTTRHLLVPVLLLAYVATTGFNPPAVRTLIMFSVWAVCRGLLLNTPALNIIFLSAAALLLYNPLYLFDLGFQYSFTVVAFLVGSSSSISSWAAGIGEKLSWIPAAAVSPWQRRRVALLRQMAVAIAGCVIAWLASSGISIYYQGFLFPAAAALNLLIIPFVWLIFIVAGIKMAVPPWPWTGIDAMLGSTLDYLIGIMSGMCEAGARFLTTIHLTPPSVPMVFLFTTALAIVIAARRRTIFLAAAAMLMLLPVSWHLTSRLQPPSVSFITGSGNPVALLLDDPGRRLAIMVNVPGDDVPRLTAALLKKGAQNEIDQLLLTGATREYCSGLKMLQSGMPVRELITPSPRGGSTAAGLLPLLEAGGTRIMLLPTDGEYRINTPLLRFSRQNRDFRFEYTPAGFKIMGRVRQDEYGGTWLEAETGRGPGWRTEIDNTTEQEVRTCSFDEQT